MKIVYDQQLMKYIILFENLTKVRVKDAYLRNGSVWFVIEKGGMFRAVGKNGFKVKKIENMLKKKVKLIEYDENICKFSSGLIYPVKARNIELVEKNLVIEVNDTKSKGLLIGRERKNLNELKEVLSRYFKFDDVVIK
jgi:transcription termination/antitermination protein NusA